ncbi:hypothetical protein DYU11_31155 [Fibrisoma montanum]|uniref:PIN domain-containing protein n=1 Tax=Fibrisoma montanum TaxID=2305895 RepID=A0A418LWU1_9BACT|nr:hypothetical protein [Fibrisoma montanum]RIV17702.1 hypothetical protein DYU11_31155 [Fibrisoma montanum]
MRKFVAIDTHTFIWGVKKESSVGQEFMIPKTLRFFDYLWEDGYNIIIPTPVLGEALVPIPLDEHYKVLSKINRRMMLASYDPQSAAIFADMYNSFKKNDELNEYKKLHAVPRERVKIDYMIAAIAKTYKAECIYSQDPHITKFAGSFIDVKCIPDIPYQTEIIF